MNCRPRRLSLDVIPCVTLNQVALNQHDRYLPPHWKAWLRAYRPESDGRLSVYDFKIDQSVRLRFEDGSTAQFEYAFCALDEKQGELAVFTEHCGYHVFRAAGLEWEGRQESVPGGKEGAV